MTETTATKGGTKVAVPKIYGAMLAVASGVGTIPKNGVMKFGGTEYKYVKNDDILEKISTLLVEHNIVVKPSFTVEDVNRGSRPFVYVNVTQTYISTEDGSEFQVDVVGEAAAGDDKSVRKAVTQAQKIANLLTFSIATGEPDPDALDVQPVAPAQATQSPAAKKIAAAKGGDAASLANEIKAFLGSSGQAGSGANAVGARVSGGKPSSEWMADVAVLTEVLKELKAGAVE